MRQVILFLFFCGFLQAENHDDDCIVICGVCRNVSSAADNTIRNIEQLGSNFSDYAVIIYENNSTDDTAARFANWEKTNSHVVFLSETLSKKKLAASRTVRIANARNKVLDIVRKKKYEKYKYLIMVDLDFTHPWPIDEIIRTIHQPFDWDCISANGITASGIYYDRFAYRSTDFPFGPELLDHEFWTDLPPDYNGTWFRLPPNGLPRVYSAFGGLAIYKTDTIKKFSYSGTATKDLKKHYKNIVTAIAKDHAHLIRYQKITGQRAEDKILFRKNCMEWQADTDETIAVCEHVTLHASMALKGYDGIYINPKLIMQY